MSGLFPYTFWNKIKPLFFGGQASRRPSKDFPPQAGRPRHFSEVQNRTHFGIGKISCLLLMAALFSGSGAQVLAQTAPPVAPSAPSAPSAPRAPSVSSIPTPLVNLQIGNGNERQNLSTAIQIVFVMTLLTLAPSLVMLMTSFTRIVIVLGFVRTALGVPSAPANQLLIGLSLFLTFFIMAPVWQEIESQALTPYMNEQIDSNEAMDRAVEPIRTFMLRQTRPGEVDFFLDLAGMGRTAVDDLPMRVVLPAFVVSELRTAFQMGFLIFIPFLVIDFLVASTLMSMGMMMMPPTMVALPLKLLLFVLVDGWQLVVRSLVQSFA